MGLTFQDEYAIHLPLPTLPSKFNVDADSLLRLYYALHHAFRVMVPLPHDRIPWTSQTLPYAIIPFIPFFFMAYLVRRKDTLLIRLLLLPSIIASSVRVAYSYYWVDPAMNVTNWGQSLAAAFIISKSLDFAFAKDGRLKIGETKLPPIGGEVTTDIPSSAAEKSRSQQLPIPSWINDPLEIIFTFRGLGWDFGRGVYVPQETRSLERTAFLKSTFLMFVENYLILDFLESLIKLVPGLGNPEGGTMFLPQLPFFQRYALSTAVHVSTGTSLVAGFYMVYHLFTLIGVGLLRHSPLSWPPVMENPWKADSLNVFWGKRWHQLLRRMFIVFGGYPGSLIAGKVGMVFGIFLASGMFHEFSTYTMGKGLDPSITLFFLWQAIGVVGERVWFRMTGHRVQGWLGLVWVYFSIMVVGQPCVDAWHLRGLGGGLVIPPILSPTRILLWPVLEYLTILSH